LIFLTQKHNQPSTKTARIMQRISAYRFLLAFAILVSSYSFFVVNQDSSATCPLSGKSTEMMKQQDQEAQSNRAKSLPIPDLTILQKALDLVKKFI
jgi:hypothetical protein